VTVFADLREERRALLSLLADGEHWIEVRARWQRELEVRWLKRWARTPHQADAHAARLSACGHDVFVGLLPRVGRSGDAEREYAPSRVLWAECDLARASRKLLMFEPTPTAIVRSGGVDGGEPKRHGYWLLDRALPREDVHRHVLRLARHLEADEASLDAARVLRVPGSRSHKTGRVARLESFTGEAHALDDIVGDLPDPEPERNDGALRGHTPPARPIPAGEGRHRYLKDRASGLVYGGLLDVDDVAAVLELLFARRCEQLPPPRRDEFSSIARWAVEKSDIAERARAREEFARWVARIEINEERRRNGRG